MLCISTAYSGRPGTCFHKQNTLRFDDEKRAQRWDRRDWSYRKVSLRFVRFHCFLKQDRFLLSQFIKLSHYFRVHSGPSHSSIILYVVLLHVISYRTISYRLCVVIRKIYVEILHCTVYCTMRIEGRRRRSWRILRGNGGMGDVWRGI